MPGSCQDEEKVDGETFCSASEHDLSLPSDRRQASTVATVDNDGDLQIKDKPNSLLRCPTPFVYIKSSMTAPATTPTTPPSTFNPIAAPVALESVAEALAVPLVLEVVVASCLTAREAGVAVSMTVMVDFVLMALTVAEEASLTPALMEEIEGRKSPVIPVRLDVSKEVSALVSEEG